MRVIFRNPECIVLIEEKGEAHSTGMKYAAHIYRALREDTYERTGVVPKELLEPVQAAFEVWIYKPYLRYFAAYKNKNLVCEIVHRMGEQGINVKPDAIRINDCAATQCRFVSEKDEFVFNLKYL